MGLCMKMGSDPMEGCPARDRLEGGTLVTMDTSHGRGTPCQILNRLLVSDHFIWFVNNTMTSPSYPFDFTDEKTGAERRQEGLLSKPVPSPVKQPDQCYRQNALSSSWEFQSQAASLVSSGEDGDFPPDS